MSAPELHWFKSSYSDSGEAGDCVEVALDWRKSSYSDSNEPGDCLEVALDWFKSSYSDSGEPGDCVEIAPTPSTIHVRDSKNTTGPCLTFPPTAWADFLSYASKS